MTRTLTFTALYPHAVRPQQGTLAGTRGRHIIRDDRLGWVVEDAGARRPGRE